MLIDFHTHVFPDKIAEKTVQVLIQGIRQQMGPDYGSGKPLTCRPATLDGLLESMKQTNVDRSICLPIATKIEQTASINRYAETIRSEAALSFGAIHPEDPNWEAELESLVQRGFQGIKLHFQFQETDIDSPQVIRILKKCEALRLLVVFHAGEDIGLPPPIYASPEKISHVLTEVHGSNLIAAHLGGWNQWDDVEKYLVGTPILMDTAFIRDFLPKEQCCRIIRNHGADKILFGSDSPWESPADTCAYLQSVGLTDEEYQKITYRNALRILGGAETA
ncbi:MAG: amidohydrolase family protein [Oscillospiraceae bacterium]|nr:amidohydrolase family protein [Oscillospiraceae bacterium]